ncbi:MAG: 50S ribosomal protein L6 [Bdellovibrionales bacterium]|nr:50S ribosomal protein L6 [Bdellovibrionales bacterium]
MSRIGKNPVAFESGVQVTVTAQNEVIVKGAKATQSVKMRPEIKAKVEGSNIVLTRSDDAQTSKALHGLYRALVQNAVIGVTQGFTKTLILNGVGYRSAVKGKVLELNLGYSHPINFEIPAGITIAVEKNTTITVTGASKEQVGAVSAKIRSFREPEPYLGKGVRYSDETIRRKAGKAAGK